MAIISRDGAATSTNPTTRSSDQYNRNLTEYHIPNGDRAAGKVARETTKTVGTGKNRQGRGGDSEADGAAGLVCVTKTIIDYT